MTYSEAYEVRLDQVKLLIALNAQIIPLRYRTSELSIDHVISQIKELQFKIL